MDRSLFIKKLVATVGLSVLPANWVKVYDKFYLLQTFVAGFQHYYGPQLLTGFNEGDLLQLVREPDNDYDPGAIALHWNEHKIGFIPTRLNSVFARLIDIQALELHAEITHLKGEAKSWENVAVAIYCLKERKIGEALPPAAKNLMICDTPKYFSIRSSQNVISRINHVSREEKIVINMNKLPKRYERLHEKYGAGSYRQEDMWFRDHSFRILDEEDIESLLPEIKEVHDVVDDLNQGYTEISLELDKVLAA